MKKVTAILVLLTAVMGVLAGCGTGGKTDEVVSTDGSTSMEKVIGYLSESYMEEHPGVTVTYNPTGSGSGIRAVQEGRCDIGLSSRNLKESEEENVTATVIAIDGIAVVVNPQNKVDNLLVSQISALYRGEITNWSELGGADAPIVLIGREAGSGTRDGFESITQTENQCNYSQELTSTGDVVQTVASNPNAIGYASLATVKESVKALRVDGVAPSKENIRDGRYPIQRKFVFVTRKNTELSGSAKAFFDYATSEAADSWMEQAGVIPVAR